MWEGLDLGNEFQHFFIGPHLHLLQYQRCLCTANLI